MLWKTMAFVRRDWRIDASYKFAFVLELLSSVAPVISFYFVGKLVGGDGSKFLARYGGEYFPFAVVGVAFTQYLMLALGTFAGTIRRSQMAGCLEAMLSTKTDPKKVIMLSSLYSFIMKTFHVGLVFAVAGMFCGVSFGKANLLSAATVLLLTVATFSSLGIFAAAVIIILKKGDPIEWVFGSLSSLLGGALFPIEVLPRWAQYAAHILPITYSLDAMRLAVLKGYTMRMLWQQMAILAGMTAVLLPLSVWVFAKAVEKGRRDGSLMQY